jgi:hypothetical protein
MARDGLKSEAEYVEAMNNEQELQNAQAHDADMYGDGDYLPGDLLMNVNVKLSITDIDRSLIANLLDAKETKRLATRKEITELVNGFIMGLTEHTYFEREDARFEERPVRQEFDQEKVPVEYRDKPLQWQMGWYRGRYLIQPSRR